MTASYGITIDADGWAQAEIRPSWGPFDKTRRGLPWTPAEDRALMLRVAEARSVSWTDSTIRAAAVAHGRSATAIATRVSALRAGIRLTVAAREAAR